MIGTARSTRTVRRAGAVIVGAGLLLTQSACNDAVQGGLSGAGLGAGAGAIIGSLYGDFGKGAAIGAVAGGLGGAILGDQNQRNERRTGVR